ncbi:YopX family protein [Butyrivibrio sp.]|uniref:YopX family protein n=1 Tax=Butyrivibrio sp. TaxID=28121 RepID=UPI0025C57C35|nr:YopX family protein [Butyrivibrio sp.]MBQ7428371.1 hypothetical protein [Butyrivibrio sp.]MBQ9303303.1 hypothetical protein [Butyrivibrio sp.]
MQNEFARFLFRAQTRKFGEKVRMNGESVPSHWEYGACNKSTGDFSIIYDLKTGEKFPVYTDTVGQCTGITDKNAKYIYEGDIVKDSHGSIYSVQYAAGWWGFQFVSADGTEHVTYSINGTSCLSVEIIGNIYDNPELMEVNISTKDL